MAYFQDKMFGDFLLLMWYVSLLQPIYANYIPGVYDTCTKDLINLKWRLPARLSTSKHSLFILPCCRLSGQPHFLHFCLFYLIFGWKYHFHKSAICFDINIKIRKEVIHILILVFMIFQRVKMSKRSCWRHGGGISVAVDSVVPTSPDVITMLTYVSLQKSQFMARFLIIMRMSHL